MAKKKRITSVMTAVLALLTAALTLVLSACDTGMQGDILESMPDLNTSKEGSEGPDKEESKITEEGYTESPDICEVVNIMPQTVFITGYCENGADVKIIGGKEDVATKSLNGYFIAQVELPTTSTCLLEATATVAGKKESKPASFKAHYNATAEKRVDGKGVTIGKDSRLFFDKSIDSFTGKNIMTLSELKDYRDYINGKVAALKRRSSGFPISLVYVYIPDIAAIYPEFLPDGVKQETMDTRLQQIVKSMEGKTNAVIMDMTDMLKAAKNDKYPIYNITDGKLSEYGGYLVYKAMCNFMAKEYPDAAPRGLDEFDIEYASAPDKLGGDLVYYLGADSEVVKEQTVVLKPKFKLDIGSAGASEVNISDILKYRENSVSVHPPKEGFKTADDRFILDTDRNNLPSALVYRDNSMLSFFDIFAERFNNVMFGQVDDFTINMSDAERYSGGKKSLVDYVFVCVSEMNIDRTFGQKK